MYDALRFLHLLSAMAYFLFHGAVASVTFASRRRQGPDRVQVLSDVMVFAYRGAPAAGVALVLTGVAMGFMGRWWSDRWLWASMGLLLLLGILMNRLGKAYLNEAFAQARDPGDPALEAERAGTSGRLRMLFLHPRAFAIAGLGGLAVVLWLMVFKPA